MGFMAIQGHRTHSMLTPGDGCRADISTHDKTCPRCGAAQPIQGGLQRGLNKAANCQLWISVAGLILLLIVTC